MSDQLFNVWLHPTPMDNKRPPMLVQGRSRMTREEAEKLYYDSVNASPDWVEYLEILPVGERPT